MTHLHQVLTWERRYRVSSTTPMRCNSCGAHRMFHTWVCRRCGHVWRASYRAPDTACDCRAPMLLLCPPVPP
ncbi:MAG TPA: hypothetical protein VNN80_23740 [Polyangiaceae bacterium]|nr:hypothetical protein [Polyangiaceae bacterium]